MDYLDAIKLIRENEELRNINEYNFSISAFKKNKYLIKYSIIEYIQENIKNALLQTGINFNNIYADYDNKSLIELEMSYLIEKVVEKCLTYIQTYCREYVMNYDKDDIDINVCKDSNTINIHFSINSDVGTIICDFKLTPSSGTKRGTCECIEFI